MFRSVSSASPILTVHRRRGEYSRFCDMACDVRQKNKSSLAMAWLCLPFVNMHLHMKQSAGVKATKLRRRKILEALLLQSLFRTADKRFRPFKRFMELFQSKQVHFYNILSVLKDTSLLKSIDYLESWNKVVKNISDWSVYLSVYVFHWVYQIYNLVLCIDIRFVVLADITDWRKAWIRKVLVLKPWYEQNTSLPRCYFSTYSQIFRRHKRHGVCSLEMKAPKKKIMEQSITVRYLNVVTSWYYYKEKIGYFLFCWIVQ